MRFSLLAISACLALFGAIAAPAAMACHNGSSYHPSTPPSGSHTTTPPGTGTSSTPPTGSHPGTTPSGTTPTTPAPTAPAVTAPAVVTAPPATPAPTVAPSSTDVHTTYTGGGSGKPSGSPHPAHHPSPASAPYTGTAPSSASPDVKVPGELHVKAKSAHSPQGNSPLAHGVAPRASQAPVQPAGRHVRHVSDTSLPFTGLPLLLLTLIAGAMLTLGVSARVLGRSLERLARR
jgi:hypothetical protein